MQRKGNARWQGTVKEGSGTLSVQSGTLKETPFSFAARFGDGKGTNPEELIAAAHAGCFTMALSFMLNNSGFTAAKNARVSADVLYIFQFPAMTRRRFGVLIYLSGPPRPGASYRLETRATLRRP